MKSPNLFYSQLENTYYWLGTEECNRCHKDCGLKALLSWDYWQHQFIEKVFCLKCKSDVLNAGGKYQEFRVVDISFKEILPQDAVPLWPQRPSLAPFKGSSVFDVATMSIDGVKTVDRTTSLSGESWNGAKISHQENKLIEEKSK